MTRILGVDPGSVSGAYALLTPTEIIVDDLPVVDKNVSAAEFARIVKALKPAVCVLERVNSFPGQGVSSVWAFARSYGTIMGVIGALEIPLVLVSPVKWKGRWNLGRDKEKSRELAMRLFPSTTGDLARKKDAGRAEAALIALYHKLETEKHAPLT